MIIPLRSVVTCREELKFSCMYILKWVFVFHSDANDTVGLVLYRMRLVSLRTRQWSWMTFWVGRQCSTERWKTMSHSDLEPTFKMASGQSRSAFFAGCLVDGDVEAEY